MALTGAGLVRKAPARPAFPSDLTEQGRRFVDETEFTHCLSAEQYAPRVFQRRDGSWVVAYDDSGVTRIGRLTDRSRWHRSRSL